MISYSWIIFILAVLVTPFSLADDAATTEEIRKNVEKFRNTGSLTVGEVELSSKYIIPRLYEHRFYRPTWTSQEKIDDLIRLIGRADEEGLYPEDYHYTHLNNLNQIKNKGAELRADLDILLTDSLARYGYHQYFGKVDPRKLDSHWNLTRNIGDKDPATLLQEAIDSDDISEYISSLLERGPYYYRMRELLAQYRQKKADESQNQIIIPTGPALKLGMNDARVAELRKRLNSLGYLQTLQSSDPLLFDPQLEQAIKLFQQSAGIDVDGIVGDGTLAELNRSVDERIDQIRVNMERIRWIFRDIRDNKDFVLVNIAGFETMLVRDHKVVWKTRSQVGRTYRKTPIFRSDMTYVQFNPTWTVPPGILRRDIIPRVANDPDYLAQNNMLIIDNKSDETVDPDSIDWENLADRSFPYQIVQQPGPANALGRVKFIHPNNYFVFLHDTPSQELFERNVRTFSSGCIRIEHPFEFAELILNSPEWNQQSIDNVLETGQTRTVYLEKTLPVLILYWTVEPTEKNGLRFLRDVYERDNTILEELNEPFEFHLPDDMPESIMNPNFKDSDKEL